MMQNADLMNLPITASRQKGKLMTAFGQKSELMTAYGWKD